MKLGETGLLLPEILRDVRVKLERSGLAKKALSFLCLAAGHCSIALLDTTHPLCLSLLLYSLLLPHPAPNPVPPQHIARPSLASPRTGARLCHRPAAPIPGLSLQTHQPAPPRPRVSRPFGKYQKGAGLLNMHACELFSLAKLPGEGRRVGNRGDFKAAEIFSAVQLLRAQYIQGLTCSPLSRLRGGGKSC